MSADKNTSLAPPRSRLGLRGRRRGFTLFETFVAMFIMLVGLLGVVSVFSAGLHARLLAQELMISHELANMWADWIRFRLNSTPSAGAPSNTMALGGLTDGASGDFYQDTGSFNDPPGSTNNIPTKPLAGQSNVYQGYTWEVKVNAAYKPRWIPEDGTGERDWNVRLDGGTVIPAALGGAPPPLSEVELMITRGARRYKFHYIFSGVGLKYSKL